MGQYDWNPSLRKKDGHLVTRSHPCNNRTMIDRKKRGELWSVDTHGLPTSEVLQYVVHKRF